MTRTPTEVVEANRRPGNRASTSDGGIHQPTAASNGGALRTILSNLQKVRKAPGRDRWTARCPAHDDRKPSLSIALGTEGRVLVKCHAGCSIEAVLAALGLRKRDLFADTLQSRDAQAPLSDAPSKREWKICEADGTVVAIHHRLDRPGAEKQLWWTGPDGRKGLNGLPIQDLPVYGVDRLGDLEDVVVTEGETACDALRGKGISAVGTVTGAATIPGDESLRALLERHVILWPDNDDAGRAHMRRIGEELIRRGHDPAQLHMVSYGTESGDDAADAVARGDDLQGILARAMPWNTWQEPAEPGDGPILVTLADVEAEPVRWLWKNRIPIGKFSLMYGRPGVGKSFAALAVAAYITQGKRLPGEAVAREPGNVLLLAGEDDLKDTLKPRFDQLGGDPTRLIAITGQRRKGIEQGITLKDDVEALERAIVEKQPVLLIIDPIQGFMGVPDDRRAVVVRPILKRIGDLAAKYQVAIVAIGHESKRGDGDPVKAMLDSIDYTAFARSVLYVGETSDGRRGLLTVKKNLAPESRAIEFEIRPPAGKFSWIGESDLTYSALRCQPEDRGGKRDDAVDWLQDRLADGPVDARIIEEEARTLGHSPRTIKRARKDLGIEAQRQGFGGSGRWRVTLPRECPEPREGLQQLGTLWEKPFNEPSSDIPAKECQPTAHGTLSAPPEEDDEWTA